MNTLAHMKLKNLDQNHIYNETCVYMGKIHIFNNTSKGGVCTESQYLCAWVPTVDADGGLNCIHKEYQMIPGIYFEK